MSSFSEKMGTQVTEENNNMKGVDGEENPEEGDEVVKPLVDYYIPPKLPGGDVLIEKHKNLHNLAGGNLHELLHAPVKVTGENPPPSVKTFARMGLNKVVLETLVRREHKKPTPVQEGSIPVLLAGRDLMACSQTGTGKSGAYLIPIVNKLYELNKPVRSGVPTVPHALILAPVRELAIQIMEQSQMYATNTGLKTCVVYGGTSCRAELNIIRGGCHILVATCGRLLQLLEEEKVRLDQVEYFVLDEADRMLDMGFIREIKRIVGYLPPKTKRTSALFSATLPTPVQRAADAFLDNYIFVTVGIVGGASEDVHQTFHMVEPAEKRRKLFEVLNTFSMKEKILIFCSTREGVDLLTARLIEHGLDAVAIHGEKFQRERELTLKEFIHGTKMILVATSVAARGLDIPKVGVVINYDLPRDIDDYVHRIGRTGRVGHSGEAISFFEYFNDGIMAKKLVSMLRYAKQEVPEWMVGLYEKEEEDRLTDPSGALYASNDYRASNAIGSGCIGRPLPCEDPDDTWD